MTFLRQAFERRIAGESLLITRPTSSSGAVVDQSSSMGVTAYWCGVRVISETLAQLPIALMIRGARGREVASDHPAHRLLSVRPNPEMTGVEFTRWIAAQAVQYGTGYAEIEWRGGFPVGLWPLPSKAVSPVRDESGALTWRVKLQTGGHVDLEDFRVLRLVGFSANGLTGLSILDVFRESIGLGIAQQDYAARFFGGDQVPRGVLEFPDDLGQERRQRVREAWRENHGGLTNAQRIAILDGGVKFTPMAVSNEDAQFLQSRKFQISEFARIFRIPPHMLMDLERATFSNIEQQGQEFVNYTLMPWIRAWESRLNASLLIPSEQGDHYFNVRVQGLLRGDQAARSMFYHQMLLDGVMSPDEVRELEDINPQPGTLGQVYYRPLNVIPVGAGAPAASQPDERAAFAEVRVLPSMVERRSAHDQLSVQNAHAPKIADQVAVQIRQDVAAVRAIVKTTLGTRSVADFEASVRSYFAGQSEELQARMMPAFRALARSAHAYAAKVAGGDPAWTADLDRWVREYVEAFAARYVDSSTGQLVALAEQTDPEQLGAVIDGRLQTWEQVRAGQIAARDSRQMGNGIALATFGLLAVASLKWVRIGKSCPYCDSLDGKRVSTGEPFVQEGDFQPGGAEVPLKIRGLKKHPPIHRGCDCQVIPA